MKNFMIALVFLLSACSIPESYCRSSIGNVEVGNNRCDDGPGLDGGF